MKIIIEGHATACKGWTEKGRLLLSDGRKYVVEPLNAGCDQKEAERLEKQLREKPLREVATLRNVNGQWRLNSKAFETRIPFTAALLQTPIKRRSFRHLVLQSELAQVSSPDDIQGVAWFVGDDTPFLLRCLRQEATEADRKPQAEPRAAPQRADADSGALGRLRWERDFADVWVGDTYYNLSQRPLARLCIKYLAQKEATAPKTARALATVDKYVRKHAAKPASGSKPNIWDYFKPGRNARQQKKSGAGKKPAQFKKTLIAKGGKELAQLKKTLIGYRGARPCHYYLIVA